MALSLGHRQEDPLRAEELRPQEENSFPVSLVEAAAQNTHVDTTRAQNTPPG